LRRFDGLIGGKKLACAPALERGMLQLQIVAVADDERYTLPSHHRWGGLLPNTAGSRLMDASMPHLPNSAGDKDRLQ
jgi:hypothetical protein